MSSTNTRLFKAFVLHSCCCMMFITCLSLLVSAQLSYRYYDETCPNLIKIVRSGVQSAMSNETRMAASLLRLHFHDCIVNGCDGSILLDDTSTMKGEKNANPNMNSARGFEVIDAIKTNVENACPSTVSCTDILALTAREAVYLTGGACYQLPMGRRDGLTASESAANKEIPSPIESLENITLKFTSKGLDNKDVVVLSGAHTIGFAQCLTFKSRLYNFGGTNSKADPSLDSTLLENLQKICPNQANSDSNLAALDHLTTNKFDHLYYSNLVTKSGLLQSDQALMNDNETASLVVNYSKYPFLFHRDFGISMVKMGNLGVLTGNDGEIRKNCRVIN